MINDNQNKKLDDALTLINDAHLTRSEAYELFFNLKERIFSDQPSKVMCYIKHIDYEKAVNDYWDGTYEVPDGWADESSGDKE